MTLAKAITIAALAHKGQLDKGGHPFIGHPLRVMARLGPDEDAMIVGVLHDVIEDTATSLEYLHTVFYPHIVAAVDAISQRKTAGETYFDYIARVAKNPLAALVKLADLRDNMDPDRGWKDLEGMRKTRYLPAWKFLTGQDYDVERDGA